MTEYLSSFDYELIADALDVLDSDGSEATNRKQELEAWARSMAATGRGYLPTFVPAIVAAGDELAAIVDSALETHIYEPGETPDDAPELAAIAAWDAAKTGGGEPIRVLIAMEGGCVQGVVSDRGGVIVRTLDYDIEGISGSDDEPLWRVEQSDGSTELGYRSEPFEPDVDPVWMEAFENAEREPFDIEEARWRGTSDAEIARLIAKSNPQLAEPPIGDPLLAAQGDA